MDIEKVKSLIAKHVTLTWRPVLPTEGVLRCYNCWRDIQVGEQICWSIEVHTAEEWAEILEDPDHYGWADCFECELKSRAKQALGDLHDAWDDTPKMAVEALMAGYIDDTDGIVVLPFIGGTFMEAIHTLRTREYFLQEMEALSKDKDELDVAKRRMGTNRYKLLRKLEAQAREELDRPLTLNQWDLQWMLVLLDMAHALEPESVVIPWMVKSIEFSRAKLVKENGQCHELGLLLGSDLGRKP